MYSSTGRRLKIQHGDDDIPSIDGVSLYAIQ